MALALRLAMLWAIPFANGSADPNCAPDEVAHFTFARALSTGRAPTWPDHTTSIYGAFLPTPYFAQALALTLLGDSADKGRFQTAPWGHGYGAARLGSAALSALVALAFMLIAVVWTESRAAGFAVGLAIALYPQLTFLGAYTNADAFTVLAGALLVLALARWVRRGEGTEGFAEVGAASGLVLVGKMSGYFLLPITVPWLGWAIWRRRVRGRDVLSAAAGLAVVSGPILAWNAWRNGGDVLGSQRYHRFLAEVWRGHTGGQLPGAFREFVWTLFHSSFGVFENMSLYLPGWCYSAALAFLVVGLAAATVALAGASAPTLRGAAWIAGATLTNLLLVAYNSWFVDFQPQGRYLLLSMLMLTSVAVWAPTVWLRGRLRWLWPVACVVFLSVVAIQAQIQIYKHPCLPPR